MEQEQPSEQGLFEDLPIPEQPARSQLRAPRARVQEPNREQVELRAVDLESLLPADHKARIVWGFVQRQDLSSLYEPIQAVEGHAGRAAIAPQILLALWLYATLEAVGSARELGRLCEGHDAYRWICGGVGVNYHSLADFRVKQGAFLDRLLTLNLASLLAAGAVQMKRVAQDGMRVRAAAGAASFRRKPKLEHYLAQAQAQVEALKGELQADPGASSQRERAARERAAREREERIEQALARLPQLQARKRAQGKDPEEARASTTDPEATVMQMADGGYRPAYNAQLCTDCASQVIVGVDVSDVGSDMGQMLPMVEQLQARYDQRPEQMLVDGGFAKKEQIEQLAPHTQVYAPVQQPKQADRDPHQPLPGDGPGVAAWRERMGTDQGKLIYQERAASAECVNAIARNRGLTKFTVRGLNKVKVVLLWYAIAHNLMRAVVLLEGARGLANYA